MQRHFYSTILFFFIAINFLSCRRSESKLQYFRYNQASNITSLDPAFARDEANSWAVLSLFNGLVQLDDSLHIVPCIAKSWEISSDAMQYTFHLRQDVYFHDHKLFQNKRRKVVAQDFVYSFQRLIDKNVASPGAWLFLQLIDSSHTENFLQAADDSTFIIRLHKPFRPLLGILTMQYCSVVPHEIVDYYGKDFRKNPIGTGPFYMKKWIENEALILTKNENYFEEDSVGKKLPYLDGIRISFIDNKSTEFLEFLQGHLDVLTNLDANYKDILLDAEGNLLDKYKNKMKYHKSPYLATEYIGVMLDTTDVEDKQTPLLDVNLRKAMNYSIDKKMIVQYFRNGIGTPADHGILPRGMTAFDDTPMSQNAYNLDSARFYLKKSKYKNSTLKLYTNPSFAEISSFIVKQWQDLGIKAKVEVVKGPFLKEQMAKGKSNLFRASWITDYPDEESFFAMFYSKNSAPPNYTRFHDSQFDRLYEKALTCKDEIERKKLYQKMDVFIMQKMPVIPIFYFQSVRFISPRIRSLTTNAMNQLDLKRTTIQN